MFLAHIILQKISNIMGISKDGRWWLNGVVKNSPTFYSPFNVTEMSTIIQIFFKRDFLLFWLEK